MRPSKDELEAISSAFVTLNITPFSAEEKRHLARFLDHFALEFDENEAQKAFKHETTVHAMKALNHFANEYQDNEIMHEFNNEIIEVLLNLNEMHGSIAI